MRLTFTDRNGFIKLTEEGKHEALKVVKDGTIQSEEKEFLKFMNFILKFYNSNLNDAVKSDVSDKDIRLDQIVQFTSNRKKLESWFEANILHCDEKIANFDYQENGLTGKDIVSYFCGKEFQEGIKNYGWASTIEEMTDVIRRNSMLGNIIFFEQVRPQLVTKSYKEK